MSCRFAYDAGETTECELLARGGWQRLAALEQLATVGVKIADGASECPVAKRGQWGQCVCRRAPSMPMLVPVRL